MIDLLINLLMALQSVAQTLADVVGTSPYVIDAGFACVFQLFSIWLNGVFTILRGVK